MSSMKIFAIYLILIFMLIVSSSSGQIVVTHFNAAWNDPNKVSYIGELTDCDIVYVDIAAAPKLQTKHKIVVVPTVVIYKDGEEIKRFQADISFSMQATKEDMQDVIDELLMEDF
tara:strand:+ start:18206 stop:18550 length:345 start_codon:yes stop_codon:yes gene_type:complete